MSIYVELSELGILDLYFAFDWRDVVCARIQRFKCKKLIEWAHRYPMFYEYYKQQKSLDIWLVYKDIFESEMRKHPRQANLMLMNEALGYFSENCNSESEKEFARFAHRCYSYTKRERQQGYDFYRTRLLKRCFVSQGRWLTTDEVLEKLGEELEKPHYEQDIDVAVELIFYLLRGGILPCDPISPRVTACIGFYDELREMGIIDLDGFQDWREIVNARVFRWHNKALIEWVHRYPPLVAYRYENSDIDVKSVYQELLGWADKQDIQSMDIKLINEALSYISPIVDEEKEKREAEEAFKKSFERIQKAND